MSQYSFGGVPSAVPGQTNLYPSRSYPVAVPAAAAAPIAAQGARGLGAALLAEVLGNLIAGGIKSGSEVATGAFGPTVTQGGSGSKFMITLQDVRDIEQYVNSENFKRQALNRLGFNYELLDAQDIIRDREAELRRSAAEAGAREYAIEQLKQQGTIQSALAQAAGQGAQSLSGAIQAGAQSLGGVAQQGISSALARPDYGTIISEVGRAY
jgi:hypothetical protein